MSVPLPALEKDRSEVLRQISHLGDLRPGSIVEVMGRCSKPNGHCARPGDPGHGPHFRLTRKVQGKTVAETLSSPAALRKAQREVAEFRKFQQFGVKLVEVNEAKTREVQLGGVFTPTTWDPEGYPIRAPDSTTSTGAGETAEEFGRRLYQEAGKRGWGRAQRQVGVGDGAEWIGNLAARHFPGAMEIVDLYHARQHLWDLARSRYPQDEGKRKDWMKVHQKRLQDRGKSEKLVGALRSIPSPNSAVATKLRTAADYFPRNAQRMRYPQFPRPHLFVGSGVIEAGCKTVVASRLQRSGRFWTVRGAHAILALRCSLLNGRFEDYWEDRRAAMAA